MVISTTKSEVVRSKVGPWGNLVAELVDKVLEYVGDPDMMGYIMMTSKNVFKPTERVFQFICHSIYSKQTLKKQLRIEKWLTWRNMLINRPRLRLNGFYSLKTLFTRAPCNDNFWEPKQYASIETKYFRYLRFFEDGKVLYSKVTVEPNTFESSLRSGAVIPKRIYEGSYVLVGQQLCVTVELHYCVVQFELLLANGDDGYRGHHNMLLLISHATLPLATADNVVEVERTFHKLPKRIDFRFYRFYNHLDLTNT